MNKLEAMMEAERRGILPADKVAILNEARNRGLVDKVQNPRYDVSMEQPNTTVAQTVVDKGLQGATFGFGDEITSAIAAPIAATGDDRFGQSFSGTWDAIKDAYSAGQDLSKQSLEAQSEQHPLISLASELGGSMVGGTAATKALAPVAGKAMEYVGKAPQAIDDVIGYFANRTPGVVKNAASAVATKMAPVTSRVTNTASAIAPVATSAAKGAVSAGAYGFGTGEAGNRLENAKDSAVMGGIMGAAAPMVSRTIDRVFSKIPTKTAQQLTAQANKMYDTADELGGVLKPEFTNKFIDSLDNFNKQTEFGKALQNNDIVNSMITKLESVRNKPMTLRAAQEVDEILGEMIDSYTENGKIDKVGKTILDIQTHFRDLIKNASPNEILGDKRGFDALQSARGMWAQSRKMGDIERIITRAEMSDQPAAALKSGFRTLYNSPQRMRGFTPDEAAAVAKVADTGIVTDLFRTLGSRLIPIGTTIAGAGLTPVAQALAISTAARGAASNMQVNKALDVARTIANQGVMPVPKHISVPGSNAALGDLANKFSNYLNTPANQ